MSEVCELFLQDVLVFVADAADSRNELCNLRSYFN